MALDEASTNSTPHRSTRRPIDGASILIILLGALGDVVRGLALIDQLRRNFSNLRITWLVEPKCRDIVALHPGIDELLVFERAKGIVGAASLIRELRKRNFDITLDLQRHFKSGCFSLFSGASRRIGFNRANTKEGNWIFNNEFIGAVDEDSVAKLVIYLSFINALGGKVQEPLNFGLALSDQATQLEAISAIPKSEYTVLVLGSSWKSKNWPQEGYVGLLDLLKQRYPRISVVLVGDKSQATLSQELVKHADSGSRQISNLVGKTSLEELCQVIRGARFCVGPDSGPAHIAGAFGVPYISLFGPTSPQRVAPYKSEHLALQSNIGCAPCYLRECPGLGGLCMKLLTPHAVLDKVQEILDE